MMVTLWRKNAKGEDILTRVQVPVYGQWGAAALFGFAFTALGVLVGLWVML